MSNIFYKTDVANVDWSTLKSDLMRDNFDNGRTAGQLRLSFENSQAVCFAYAGERIIGTARALSDSVCNAYVIDVWTHSDYRRQGIGTRMMELLVAGFEGQHVHLMSDLPEFYENIGYKRQDISLSKIVGEWLQNETLNAPE